MLAPSRLTVAMSPPPMPPAPIPATLIRSLGAMYPAPPSTWRGTTAKFERQARGRAEQGSSRVDMSDDGPRWDPLDSLHHRNLFALEGW